MTTRIRFLGLAAFEITNSQNQVILIDPCLEKDNPVSRGSDSKWTKNNAKDWMVDGACVVSACPVPR